MSLQVRSSARKPYVLIALSCLLVAAAACETIRANQPVTNLTDLQQLRQEFDRDVGKVRVVALLSPV